MGALCIGLLLGFSDTAQAQPDPEFYEVKLPMDISSDFCQGRITWNQQVEYQIDLLRLAAKLSGKDIIITPVCMDYPTEERRISMLQANDDINMVHFGTSQEREDKLLAAYVPLYLGTTGLRFFMVRRELLDDLQAVHTLDDLRKFTMGQGLGWPDSAILIENGFSVADGRYKTLHRMLDARRFDLYPRAYWQIIGEWNWMKDQAPGIVVSPDVALYYPQPIYFFFSPHHPQLRDAIQTGLERAYSNGMLFDLLKSHPDTAPSFGGIKLNNVRVIRGMNNKLPDRSRHAMSEYGLFD